ncbi:kinetochore Sim4 complex subunit FTA2-domain-containing protein [Xylaria cf. heliscus]|nr:kinetochore Sim4 complex subunit FTA2-domain-containing protein [Xylaria cf. heliscus]
MAPDVDKLLRRRQPVPPCEGPKLKAFRHFRTIEFLQLLSCDPTSPESRAGHGYVFDVRIDKERFALKMFKFYDASEARYEITHPLRRKVTDETLTFHSDPFFAECRAYAKIHQHYGYLDDINPRRMPRRGPPGPRKSKKRLPAVPCYGYITLAADYEDMLRDKFDIFDWDRSELEDSRQVTRKPFRCLVKKLIPSQISISNPRRMLADLKQLRKMGIFARDIFARNYKDGLLVDFSVAWTEPHWCLQVMGPYQLSVAKKSDLSLFDMMIRDEGIKTTVRATRNWEFCDKLRSSDVTDDSDTSSVWALRQP